MKNKLIIILMLFLCFQITACGNNSGKSGTEDGNGIHAMLTVSDGSDAFRTMLAEAAMEAAEAAGMSLEIKDAQGSTENQMNQIKDAENVDVFICALCDSGTAQQMEALAGDRPIVFINSCPEEDYLEEDQYIYVGSNEEVAGQLQADYILNKYSDKDTLHVAIIKGEKNHSATKGRTRAVKETLEASGKKIQYVYEDYADWSTDTAKNMFQLFLKTGQELDCVISNNDSMAIGIVQSAKENHLSFESLPILGVDATTDGLAAVAAGEMACTIFQPAAGQGQAAVKAAIRMVKKESIAAMEGAEENGIYVWVPFETVTKDNVGDYK